MASSLNISLTDELRRFVDMRASDHDLYSTPSEYVRDLIRQDMRVQRILSEVMQGLHEVKNNKSVKISPLDIFNEN